MKGKVEGKTIYGVISTCDKFFVDAYSVAVRNGYKGTEKEWLASLKGEPGASVSIVGSYDTEEELRAEHPVGYPGESYLVNGALYVWSETKQDWVNVGNIKGKDGDDGKSAYEYAQDGGYTGSETDFAAKLATEYRPVTWTPTAEEVGATPESHATDNTNPHDVTVDQIGAAPKSHISDRNNPHGVTAEQVGARPKTWTPTASEVGARPKTWTPTASEVGARPNTWMPTAEDVLALNLDFITDNDHMIASGDDLHSTKYTVPGSYRCSSGVIAATLKNSIPRTDTGFRLIVTAQSSTSGVVQIAILNTKYTGIYVRTMTTTDTWGDWVELSHSGNSGMYQLWENLSPASTFDHQNIQISGEKYDCYMVVAHISKNTEPLTFLPATICYKGKQGHLIGLPNNKNGRRGFYVNSTGTIVTFEDTQYCKTTYGTAVEENDYIIPMYIYGMHLN